MSGILFSHSKDPVNPKNMWETPRDFFEKLDSVFHYTLDIAASHRSFMVYPYVTQKDNAFRQNPHREIIWCNPPYANVGDWVRLAHRNAQKDCMTTLLIPARTETKAWQDLILPRYPFLLVAKRLKFLNRHTPLHDLAVDMVGVQGDGFSPYEFRLACADAGLPVPKYITDTKLARLGVSCMGKDKYTCSTIIAETFMQTATFPSALVLIGVPDWQIDKLDSLNLGTIVEKRNTRQ